MIPLAPLQLPEVVTVRDATGTKRLLTQALRGAAGADVVIDASPLRHFDSSALAVLLECQRIAAAQGKTFSVRGGPPKLAALAHLYGLDSVLSFGAVSPVPATGG